MKLGLGFNSLKIVEIYIAIIPWLKTINPKLMICKTNKVMNPGGEEFVEKYL